MKSQFIFIIKNFQLKTLKKICVSVVTNVVYPFLVSSTRGARPCSRESVVVELYSESQVVVQ